MAHPFTMDEANQEENQETQNQEESQQESSTLSEPQSDLVSRDDFNRFVAMQERMLNQANERARIASEEAETLRNRPAPRQEAPRNYEELNRRVSEEGQLAQVVEETVEAVMSRRMQPLLDKSVKDERKDKLSSLVSQVISAHPYARKLEQGHKLIMDNIINIIGNVDPTYRLVQMAFRDLLGQALEQDPQFFDKIPDPSAPTPQVPPAPSNAPVTNTNSNKPLPPRIPNGRPPVSQQGKKSILTPAEQKLKASMPGVANLTDEEWKQEFYAEGQSREYDTAKMNQPKKEGTK